MKARLPFIIAMLIACTVVTAQVVTDGKTRTEVFSLSAGLPQFDTSFDDLDVRDAYNQPVQSLAKKQELQSIFQENLFTLLLLSDIHSVARAMALIKEKLNLSRVAFSAGFPILQKAVVDVFLSGSKKRSDLVLICLLGFFSLKIIILFFKLFAFHFSLTERETTPLPLRC